MNEYQVYNDPVRQFFDDVRHELAWDFLPFAFLYDLYCAWMKKNNPSGNLVGSLTFRKNIENIIHEYPEWQLCGKNPSGGYDRVSPKEMIERPEYLSLEYDLKNWLQPHANTMRDDLACVPPAKGQYRGGLIRTTAIANIAQTGTPGECAG